MRTSLIAIALLVITLAGLVGLSACSSQRALSIVRRDGDRALARAQYETARTNYQEVVDRAPADWRYRVKLAKALMILDEPEQAQEQFALAYAVRPQDDAIAEDLAKAMFASHDQERLISFLLRRAQDTQTVHNYLRLGWYAAQTGDADLAERALRTAVRLDAGSTVKPLLALADFYSAAGDKDEALRQLRIALGVNPADEAVQRRIRAMGEIPGISFALHPDSD